MKCVSRLLLSVAIVLVAASPLMAGRLPGGMVLPRPAPGEWAHASVPVQSTIAALGIGNSRGLTFGDAFTFLYAEEVGDIFYASPYLCEGEPVNILGSMYTPKDRDVTATVEIRTAGGSVYLNESYTFLPEPEALIFVLYDAGVLPVESLESTPYKITFKYKQGRAIVGQSFWTVVIPGDDPLCSFEVAPQ